MANFLGMRNLIWLLVIVGLLGVWFRYQTPLPKPEPVEKIGIAWQDFQKGLVFTGDRNSSQVFLPWNTPRGRRASGIQELHARLLPEIPQALEEPCRGEKAQELTLIQGFNSWTVTIGTRPGKAQQRIRKIMAEL